MISPHQLQTPHHFVHHFIIINHSSTLTQKTPGFSLHKNCTQKLLEKTAFQGQIARAGGSAGKKEGWGDEWCVFYRLERGELNMIGDLRSQSKFIFYNLGLAVG